MAKITPFDIDSQDAAKNVESFATQVKKAFIDLQNILLSLSPIDNFKRHVWTGVIPISSEVMIPHRLGRVPTGYWIIRRSGGSVEDGVTEWTKDAVYLRNVSAVSAATTTVVFFL